MTAPMTIILHYALPSIIPQALHEQGRGYLLAAPGEAEGDARLLLLGVADDAPERLAAWRGAGLRAPALLLRPSGSLPIRRRRWRRFWPAMSTRSPMRLRPRH